MVSEDKQMCFLADSPQKVDNIHLAICFPFSFSGLFRLRIAMNVIFFSVPYCTSRFVSTQIYHRIDGILLASSKFGQRLLVMKSKLGDLSQSETT